MFTTLPTPTSRQANSSLFRLTSTQTIMATNDEVSTSTFTILENWKNDFTNARNEFRAEIISEAEWEECRIKFQKHIQAFCMVEKHPRIQNPVEVIYHSAEDYNSVRKARENPCVALVPQKHYEEFVSEFYDIIDNFNAQDGDFHFTLHRTIDNDKMSSTQRDVWSKVVEIRPI